MSAMDSNGQSSNCSGLRYSGWTGSDSEGLGIAPILPQTFSYNFKKCLLPALKFSQTLKRSWFLPAGTIHPPANLFFQAMPRSCPQSHCYGQSFQPYSMR